MSACTRGRNAMISSRESSRARPTRNSAEELRAAPRPRNSADSSFSATGSLRLATRLARNARIHVLPDFGYEASQTILPMRCDIAVETREC